MTVKTDAVKAEIKAWPPLKKAIWDVVVAEELNGPAYVNAWDLVDKIHTAALSASPAGVVKPLKWKGRDYDCKAETIIGTYRIDQFSDKFRYFPLEGRPYVWFETLEAAKSAAFEDYSARIMSAIEPAAPQCCMCGKKGLSTIEGDGGTECELEDGRWVCSAECWDRAVEPAGVGVEATPPSSHVAGPFFDIAGFGASYQREGNQWLIYTMPGAKRIGSVDGYDKARLDWIVEALRAAHAQSPAFSSWVPPTGTKRAIVEELRKARGNFMINDFEIADRVVDAIRRLASEEATDNIPPPQTRASVTKDDAHD